MRIRLLVLSALFAQILLGFWGAAVNASPVLSGSQQAASILFSDDFEAGALGASWSTGKTASGVVELNTVYPHSGAQGVFLGQKLVGNASGSLVLALNLSG